MIPAAREEFSPRLPSSPLPFLFSICFEILHAALAKQNIEAQRYVVKGAGHGGPLWIQPEIMKLIIDFFDAHLK